MTVYIAAPYKRKKEARTVEEILLAAGFESTSRWIHNHLDGPQNAQVLHREAMEDLLDIHRAQALVLLDTFPGEGAGMFTEFGFALAKGKRIYVIGGESPNVFYHHPAVTVLPGVEHLIKEAA